MRLEIFFPCILIWSTLPFGWSFRSIGESCNPLRILPQSFSHSYRDKRETLEDSEDACEPNLLLQCHPGSESSGFVCKCPWHLLWNEELGSCVSSVGDLCRQRHPTKIPIHCDVGLYCSLDSPYYGICEFTQREPTQESYEINSQEELILNENSTNVNESILEVLQDPQGSPKFGVNPWIIGLFAFSLGMASLFVIVALGELICRIKSFKKGCGEVADTPAPVDI